MAKCSDYEAVLAAQAWLAEQQSKGGRWNCELQQGGHEIYDVGVTGLALLALQGYGNTLQTGPYQDNVERGVQWLVKIQDRSGLLGNDIGQATMFNQAIATLALLEAYVSAGKPPYLREAIERSLALIHKCRNPYAGWHYSPVSNSHVDTAVTVWVCYALQCAQAAGFEVEAKALEDSEAWFRDLSGEGRRRVGYSYSDGTGPGGPSYRYLKPHDNSAFDREKSSGLTAAVLAIRLFGPPPMAKRGKVDWTQASFADDLSKQIVEVRRNQPGLTKPWQHVDLHYWFWGSLALHQFGGDAWEEWQARMRRALLPAQQQGSWQPDCAWGAWGGQVYSTAMACLILQTEMRLLNAEQRCMLRFKASR